jgi:signal transduction histidine kinase
MTVVGIRKNRDEFPAEASISKLDTGRKTLLTIALRDITERKRTEMEQQVLAEAGTVLAQSLNYKQTLTTIAELVVRHTGDMCIVDMIEDDARVRRLTVAHADPTKAAACEALAQLSLETGHLVGASLETKQALVFDDINPEVLEATGQDEDQLRMLREIAPRSAIVVPLLSADRVLGYLVLASSRPRRYVAHDLRLLTELARRASLAIENARLYAAAQRATRARDDMMGIVAHDVRSPLQAIRLAAQVLERKLAKAGVADGGKNLENILLSVGRANRLIEDLLEITRIEAGAMALSCSVLAPLPVVSEGLDFQRLAAAEASLELRLEIAEELPAIWADRHRLLQVLENLIGNAIKFTPEGGRVTIAAAGRPGEIAFSVADTGTGIPPHSLPHVFDRFWQAERAERHGAGLGLPICKGIVEAHGGRIWVESTPDRGSTIFFTIPTATGAAPLPRESSSPFA